MLKDCQKKNNTGMAIVVVIFFAFCMLILFGVMMFRQSSTAQHNVLSLQERQAFFAAQAAIQHFLLKAKYFPTELYDAVGLSQGKNPLADFTEFPAVTETGQPAFEPFMAKPDVYVRIRPRPELDIDGQPRFFYFKPPQKDVFIRLGSFRNADYRFLAPAVAYDDLSVRYANPIPPDASLKPDKYLKYFIRDCTNSLSDEGHPLQPLLEIKIAPTVSNIHHWDIKTSEGYPYTMEYKVSKVQIQSIEGLKKYGEEALEILVEGRVKDFKDKTVVQTQKRIEKITRKGALP